MVSSSSSRPTLADITIDIADVNEHQDDQSDGDADDFCLIDWLNINEIF